MEKWLLLGMEQWVSAFTREPFSIHFLHWFWNTTVVYWMNCSWFWMLVYRFDHNMKNSYRKALTSICQVFSLLYWMIKNAELCIARRFQVVVLIHFGLQSIKGAFDCQWFHLSTVCHMELYTHHSLVQLSEKLGLVSLEAMDLTANTNMAELLSHHIETRIEIIFQFIVQF